MISDRLFNDDIEKAARLHSAAVQSPVFSYYFDYRSMANQAEFTNDTGKCQQSSY